MSGAHAATSGCSQSPRANEARAGQGRQRGRVAPAVLGPGTALHFRTPIACRAAHRGETPSRKFSDRSKLKEDVPRMPNPRRRDDPPDLPAAKAATLRHLLPAAARPLVHYQPYYRCSHPPEYQAATSLEHPRTVYLRKADLLPHLDQWLPRPVRPRPPRPHPRRPGAGRQRPHHHHHSTARRGRAGHRRLQAPARPVPRRAGRRPRPHPAARGRDRRPGMPMVGVGGGMHHWAYPGSWPR